MKLFATVVCLSSLLGIAICHPVDAPNAKKQLNLAHTCIRIGSNKIKSERAPVVLLHGVLAFKEVWLSMMQIIALETGRRVCAVDLRNHADSPWSDETDTATMASDLNLLMKTLKMEKIALLGHSLGGKVAIDFTLNNPDKVEKLIVEDMRPNGMSDEARTKVVGLFKPYKYALNAIPEGTSEKDAKIAAYKFIKGLLETVNETLEIDERIIKYMPLKCEDGKCRWKSNVALLEKVAENLEYYMPNVTGLFENPALFIYGEISEFRIGDVKDEILQLFPNAKLVKVKGAKHHVKKFPEYKDAVINFLNAEN